MFNLKLPVILTEPVKVCIFNKSLPNWLLPDENTIDDVTCWTLIDCAIIWPVVVIPPLTITSLANTTGVPLTDDCILLPLKISVVPFNTILPLVGSNNISPSPLDFNSILPFADCNVMLSEPASKILIDWPLSVVICNSCVVLLRTFVPSIYNDAEDKYKSLNWFVGLPKS